MAFGQRNRPEPESSTEVEKSAAEPSPAPERQPQAAEQVRPARNGNGNGKQRQPLRRFDALVTDVPFYRRGENGRQSVTTINAILLDRDGTPTKEVRIAAWRQLAKEAKMLAEGDKIQFDGLIRPPRTYDGRDGKVTVDNEIDAADISVYWGNSKVAIEDFDRDALQAGKTLEQDPGPDFSTF